MHRIRNLGRTLRSTFDSRRIRRMIVNRLARRHDAEFDEILSPGVEIVRDGSMFVDRNWSPVGVTQQFTDDAETYHQRYFVRLDFDELIDYCLTLADVGRQSEMRILDIGSGSGSSVFAAFRLLPRSEIFASDLSPQLLGMLAAFVESRADLRGRVRSFCFDLHRRFFKPEIFDLVIGTAILHHLLDPKAALSNVARSLKPGGKIILVEPLESGSLILTVLWANVLRILGDLGQGDSELARLMKAMRLDIQHRLGPPAAKPWTPFLDDKWVFDEPYLIRLAHELGMSKIDIHPGQADLTRIFESAFRSQLSDSGLGGISVPEQVMNCVREFDESIGPGLKGKICPTGIIVFTK
jgi:SAM-dependent methyltransferase